MRKLLLSVENSPELNEAEKNSDPAEIARSFIDIQHKTEKKRYSLFPRASGLYKSCMRQGVLCYKKEFDFDLHLGIGMRLTFEIGNSFHYWVQNTPRILGNNRRGRWRCSACRYLTLFGPSPTYSCPRCKAAPDAFIYEEIQISMEHPYYLSGHPDMFVERPAGNFRIMEIKSINSKDFNYINNPLPEHVWQVHSYMLACIHDSMNISVTVDKDICYITYISKAYERNNFPVKTFIVKRDLHIMAMIKDKLAQFKTGIEDGILPLPIPGCLRSNFENAVAKSCPVISACRGKHE